jgi:ferric-dicitrate binding protein FerR (iron transport regulator)
MKHIDTHIDPEPDNRNSQQEFFRRMDIPYTKNREEVWSDLEKKITTSPSPRIMNFYFRNLSLAAAAAIILLAGIFSILRFYTTTVYSPAGQHLSHVLPDGSIVKLNAESEITYKSLWWRFVREVKFEGEAYFEVEKGNKFSVASSMGTTEVLGTSFNIYSRGEEYNVTCITGQVKVISTTLQEVILSPEYEARVSTDGNIIITKEMASGMSHSWISNMFHFASRPLPMVLNEISRQYNITIKSDMILDYSYTGYFSKERTAEEVLDFVCKPFGLTFARIAENEYEIYQSPD